MGLQMILFPYLVTEVLQQSPANVGIAQMSLMAPSILFMLVGGATAERRDGRALLTRYNICAIIPPTTLALAIIIGELSYGLLILYALAMGTLSAFALPTRDAMLNSVVDRISADHLSGGEKIQQGVVTANAIQFLGQTVGMLAAMGADGFGIPILLASHALMALIGAIAAHALIPSKPVLMQDQTQSTFEAIREGIVEVYRSDVLLPLVMISMAVGLFFVGSFLVCFPLFVRDLYGGGAGRLATLNVSFWLGTILATVILMRVGPLEKRGRALILALASGTIVLAAMSLDIPFALMCALTFFWGMGGGVSLTMSRGIVQEVARDSHRARVLSIYQLGFNGGTPIGAFCMGFLIEGLGMKPAVLVPATIMFLFLIVLTLRTNLWSLGADLRQPAPG